MADNTPTNRNNELASNLMGMAIGLSIVDALGDGGEIYARRNSSIFNNNFDAFGLPRNRFSLMQNILPRQEDSPMWGTDLRTILGANAEVYPGNSVGPGSLFGMGIMNMLFGNGIFGRAMGDYDNAFAGEGEKLQRMLTGQAVERPTPPAPGANAPTANAPTANAPTGTAAGSITSASGARIEEPLQTVTVPGEDGEAPVAVAASRSRIASTSSSASSARTQPAAAKPPEMVTTTRMMPLDTPDGLGVSCEVPKPAAPAKLCTITKPKSPFA